MKMLLYILISILAVAISIVFTVLNPGEIDLNLYFKQYSVPFSVVIIISMFVGVLLGLSVSLIAAFSRMKKNRVLKKQLKDSQMELSTLRKKPIEEP